MRRINSVCPKRQPGAVLGLSPYELLSAGRSLRVSPAKLNEDYSRFERGCELVGNPNHSTRMEKSLAKQIENFPDSKFDLPIRPRDPSVRSWPYPFLAGLTISNDAEFMSEDLLEELLRYSNSSEMTEFGRGLGLQMSSSLFFYSSSTCSVFSGVDVKSPEAPWSNRALEYIRTGLIDTNHAFGEFDEAPIFVRAHAERAYDWMSKHGVSLSGFSNHGGTNNRQNVGIDADYHEGDRSSSPAYHSDLLRSGGVKFVWTDSKSYEILSVPAPKPVSSESEVRPSLFARWRGSSAKGVGEVQPVEPHFDPVLLEDSNLRDGARIHTFTRFRGTGANAPNVSSFYSQVTRAISPEFYLRQGAIILYQHFGVLYREGGKCVKTTVESIRSNPAGFLSAWRVLARECHEGRLWMPTAHRFLSYVRTVESISLRHDDNGHIAIISLVDNLTPDDFDGLTIYVSPETPVTVSFRSQNLSIRRNGPDQTGRYSVTVSGKRNGGIWN